jgi:hypothetical protein
MAGASKSASQTGLKILPRATSPEVEALLYHAGRPGGVHGRSDHVFRRNHQWTLTSKRGTATILSGYLSADKFNFVINIPIESSFEDVKFSGTFDGASVKGSISVAGYSIDFTGVKPTLDSSLAEFFHADQGDGQ